METSDWQTFLLPNATRDTEVPSFSIEKNVPGRPRLMFLKSEQLTRFQLPEADDAIPAGTQRLRSLPAHSDHILGTFSIESIELEKAYKLR